jgi:hypothetical protein
MEGGGTTNPMESLLSVWAAKDLKLELSPQK